MTENKPHTTWKELLQVAMTEPGTLSAAYTAFHSYSIGNQILALLQCKQRGILPSPINTFPGWRLKCRWVRKGEKAITLCMPITVKRRDAKADDDESETSAKTTIFAYKPHWFTLSQTDGQDYTPDPLPGWDEDAALAALHITRIPFAHVNGNILGYAINREIAISPLAPHPHRTLLHEAAHVVLGHTAEKQKAETEQTPRDQRELEAEGVALLLIDILGTGDQAESRGYMQHWYGRRPIPEDAARRIITAADRILKAGKVGASTAAPIAEPIAA